MEPTEYEAFVEMFATDGWKLFIEGLTGDFQAGNNLLAITDEKDFLITKGRMQLVSEILGFEEMLRLNKEAEESESPE